MARISGEGAPRVGKRPGDLSFNVSPVRASLPYVEIAVKKWSAAPHPLERRYVLFVEALTCWNESQRGGGAGKDGLHVRILGNTKHNFFNLLQRRE